MPAFTISGNPNLPVSTRDETQQAIKFAASNNITDPVILQSLEKYATRWGLKNDYDREMTNKQSSHCEVDYDRDFALVMREGDTVVEARYPLATPAISAHSFIKEAAELPAELRQATARKLIAAGAQQDQLHKFARDAQINEAGLLKAAEVRLSLYRDPEHRAAMQELLDKKASCPAEVLVAGMDMLDRQEGFHRFYGHTLDLPENQIYGGVKKSSSVSVALMNGRTVTLEKLASIKAEKLRIIGDDLARDLKNPAGGIDLVKAAEVLPTLPLPEADILISLIA